MTGSQAITEELGIALEQVTLDSLGSARLLTLDKDSTTIVNGAGRKELIAARVSQLKTQREAVNSEYDREQFQERLAKLAGGVARSRKPGLRGRAFPSSQRRHTLPG